jgi:hypothetical protein
LYNNNNNFETRERQNQISIKSRNLIVISSKKRVGELLKEISRKYLKTRLRNCAVHLIQ